MHKCSVHHATSHEAEPFVAFSTVPFFKSIFRSEHYSSAFHGGKTNWCFLHSRLLKCIFALSSRHFWKSVAQTECIKKVGVISKLSCNISLSASYICCSYVRARTILERLDGVNKYVSFEIAAFFTHLLYGEEKSAAFVHLYSIK